MSMVRLSIHLVLVSAVFAIPIAEVSNYADDLPLGSCDASGLPSSVMESLGLDPNNKYEFNEKYIDIILTVCKDLDVLNANFGNYTQIKLSENSLREFLDSARLLAAAIHPDLEPLVDIVSVLMIKSVRAMGEFGYMLCDEAIEELSWCQKDGYCSSEDRTFESLPLLSSDDWEETLEKVKETKKVFEIIREIDGDTTTPDWFFTGEDNLLINEILTISFMEATTWVRNCALSFKDIIEPLAEKECPLFMKHSERHARSIYEKVTNKMFR